MLFSVSSALTQGNGTLAKAAKAASHEERAASNQGIRAQGDGVCTLKKWVLSSLLAPEWYPPTAMGDVGLPSPVYLQSPPRRFDGRTGAGLATLYLCLLA